MNDSRDRDELVARFFSDELNDAEIRHLHETWKESECFRSEFQEKLALEYELRFFGRLSKEPLSVEHEGRKIFTSLFPDAPSLAVERDSPNPLELNFDEIIRMAALQSSASSMCIECDNKRSASRSPNGKRLAVPCLCLAVLVFGLLLYGIERPRSVSEPTNAVILTGFDRPEWGYCESPFCVGDSIQPGWIRLKSGRVAIKLACGAEAVLEGPAELRVDSGWKLFLFSGYLSVRSPKLHKKLVVETSQATIRVLGTSFWIQSDTVHTDIHMIQGNVSLEGPSFKTFQLSGGEAVSIDKKKRSSVANSRVTGFVAPEVVVRKMNLRAATKEKSGSVLSAGPSVAETDPALVCLFTFDGMGREVANRAGKAASGGVIHRCSKVTSPLSNTSSVLFRSDRDYVGFDVPKSMSSFTFATWVKFDKVPTSRKSLIVSEGSQEGAVNWIVNSSGEAVLNLNDPDRSNFLGPYIAPPRLLGTWIHLAVTADRKSQTLNWYLNGKNLESCFYPDHAAAQIGEAFIGLKNSTNRGPSQDGGFACSELRIYRRALTQAEIQGLCADRHY